MGDPAGVGPEVLLKSYKKAREKQNLVAISDFNKIKCMAKKYDVRLRKINRIDEAENFQDHLNILHLEYNSDFLLLSFQVHIHFHYLQELYHYYLNLVLVM